jgi:hypothetical protein
MEIMKVGFDINLILQNYGNESRWSFVPNHYSNWAATPIMIINEHQIHSRKALSYDENTSIDNYNSINLCMMIWLHGIRDTMACTNYRKNPEL